MKSDVIRINNTGLGFEAAVEQVRKAAEYGGIQDPAATQMQVIAEEMLSMTRILAGNTDVFFWMELKDDEAVFHLSTKAVLDKQKRADLISASSSRKNEAANTFLGMLRDRFEEAMAADPAYDSVPWDAFADLPQGALCQPEWDGFERSVLRKMADNVRIGISGENVEMTITKKIRA